jgi:C-terminal processing protease CtpA/Prc
MLRSGDHVIAVNGRNVSKCGHDEVVKLIGNSTGLLKLQIAESYCSNSSSEDEVQVSRKFERTAQAIVHHHHHPPLQQQQLLQNEDGAR